MLRRVHVPRVFAGDHILDATAARHARDVLRLVSGTTVEIFDDAGAVTTGELILEGRDVVVRVDADTLAAAKLSRQEGLRWTIAAAVPKGERADWMVEKLSELGVAEFIPLAAARSVVLPEGKNKRERWARIATESAKQCRRAGVMRVAELTPVRTLVASLSADPAAAAWYFSTADDARPISELVDVVADRQSLTALVGPEGGWTDEEQAAFGAAGLTPVRLTSTVLRIETAAVTAAAVIATLVATRRPG